MRIISGALKNPDVQTKLQTNPIKLPEGISGCLSPPGAFDVQPARRTAGVSRDELLVTFYCLRIVVGSSLFILLVCFIIRKCYVYYLMYQLFR